MTEQHQQMDIVKVNDDNDKSSLQALIEKVVNDEIKKLAQEKIGASEVIKLSSVPSLSVIGSPEQVDVEVTTTNNEPEPTTMQSFATEPADSATDAPAVETDTVKLETLSETLPTEASAVKVPEEVESTTNSLEPDNSATDESNSISDSLLNAVGDLLSSILGLDDSRSDGEPNYASEDEDDEKTEAVVDVAEGEVSRDTVLPSLVSDTEAVTATNESEASTEIEQGTEKADEIAMPMGYEGEKHNDDESLETNESDDSLLNIPTVENNHQDMSEIDLKIENLANAPTNFATEGILEQVTETVRDEPSESIKAEPEVLEVISVVQSDDNKPVSFDESINQVMNLVKGTEGRLALQSVGNVVDSILIDKHMKDDVNDLDQIVYGTLKEIETNMGLNEDISMPHDSYDPAVNQREEAIKKFENEINESLLNKVPFEYETFLPNSAKAALFHRHDDVVDF